jgi:hypothetical protein
MQPGFEGAPLLWVARFPHVAFVRFARPGATCSAPCCRSQRCTVEIQWSDRQRDDDQPVLVAYQAYCAVHEAVGRVRYGAFIQFLERRGGANGA